MKEIKQTSSLKRVWNIRIKWSAVYMSEFHSEEFHRVNVESFAERATKNDIHSQLLLPWQHSVTFAQLRSGRTLKALWRLETRRRRWVSHISMIHSLQKLNNNYFNPESISMHSWKLKYIPGSDKTTKTLSLVRVNHRMWGGLRKKTKQKKN